MRRGSGQCDECCDSVCPVIAPPSAGARARNALVAVCALASVFYAYVWYVQPGRPEISSVTRAVGSLAPMPAPGRAGSARYTEQLHRFGWYIGSSDQFNYAREARALVRGELPGSNYDYAKNERRPGHANDDLSDYTYPLGYPLIGAAFITAGLRGDPFLIPDAILYALVVGISFAIASRLLRAPWNWVYVVALVVATPLTVYVATPWNTTTTLVAVAAVMWVTFTGSDSWLSATGVALALSLCLSSRLVDVLWPLGLLMVWMALTRTMLKRTLLVSTIALALTTGFVMWTQYEVFGSVFTSPYQHDTAGIATEKFSVTSIPRHVWEVIISGHGSTSYPLLREWPWLLAAPFGFTIAWKRCASLRPWLSAACAASGAATLFYLAYGYTTGANLANGIFRFFVPWFPLWALLAIAAVPGALAEANLQTGSVDRVATT